MMKMKKKCKKALSKKDKAMIKKTLCRHAASVSDLELFALDLAVAFVRLNQLNTGRSL